MLKVAVRRGFLSSPGASLVLVLTLARISTWGWNPNKGPCTLWKGLNAVYISSRSFHQTHGKSQLLIRSSIYEELIIFMPIGCLNFTVNRGHGSYWGGSVSRLLGSNSKVNLTWDGDRRSILSPAHIRTEDWTAWNDLKYWFYSNESEMFPPCYVCPSPVGLFSLHLHPSFTKKYTKWISKIYVTVCTLKIYI